MPVSTYHRCLLHGDRLTTNREYRRRRDYLAQTEQIVYQEKTLDQVRSGRGGISHSLSRIYDTLREMSSIRHPSLLFQWYHANEQYME